MKIPPLLIVFLNIIFMYFSKNLFPIFSKSNINLFAFILICGISINIISVFLFKKNKTTVNPISLNSSKLICVGIYKYSRNPMYLGMLLTQLSFIFLFNSYLALFFPIFFFAFMNFVQIPKEEKSLEDFFGEVYIEYKGTTRRWI